MSAADADFICNLKVCRRALVNTAWVTSCSHIFCEEDGQRDLRQDGESKCPVCDTVLSKKYDVVHVNLNPSEEYKSMVLAGMRPEVIMDISGRAISFWAYQISAEKSLQERVARKATSHIERMQVMSDTATAALKTELNTCYKKTEVLEKENEALHNQIQGLRDALADRGRQLQKAQSTVSMLRRSTVSKISDVSGGRGAEVISPSKSSPSDAFSMEQAAHEASITPKKSSQKTSGFSFKPAL